MQEGWQLTLFPPFDQNGKIKVGRKKDLPTVMLTYNADTWWTEERREIKRCHVELQDPNVNFVTLTQKLLRCFSDKDL